MSCAGCTLPQPPAPGPSPGGAERNARPGVKRARCQVPGSASRPGRQQEGHSRRSPARSLSRDLSLGTASSTPGPGSWGAPGGPGPCSRPLVVSSGGEVTPEPWQSFRSFASFPFPHCLTWETFQGKKLDYFTGTTPLWAFPHFTGAPSQMRVFLSFPFLPNSFLSETFRSGLWGGLLRGTQPGKPGPQQAWSIPGINWDKSQQTWQRWHPRRGRSVPSPGDTQGSRGVEPIRAGKGGFYPSTAIPGAGERQGSTWLCLGATLLSLVPVAGSSWKLLPASWLRLIPPGT